jgi:hypothetical protein
LQRGCSDGNCVAGILRQRKNARVMCGRAFVYWQATSKKMTQRRAAKQLPAPRVLPRSASSRY